MSTPQHLPRQVVLFSGKRKSGKDFVAELLQSRLGPDQCTILRLSEPLKRQYAKEHGLDLTRLLDASSYKETYREDMIRWGEEKRNRDPAYFCDLVVDRAGEGRRFPVWIVSDARRTSDIEYFRSRFGELVTSVRVVAGEEVRRTRGWVFTAGVDDAESECGLDAGVTFDVVVENNGENNDLFGTAINKLCSDIYNKL